MNIEINIAQSFYRVKKTSAKQLNGNTSLWFELRNCTNEKARQHFMSGLVGQDKMKYSKSLTIKSLITNNYYTLYKSFGIWRVGAGDFRPEVDRVALETLLNQVA